MRTLIICAAGALALAACQRPATDDAPAAADTAIDATATDATGDPAPSASTSSTRSTSASRSGSADTAPAAPAETAVPAGEGVMSGPSPAVRDAAKEKAEETNLHPKG